MLNIQQGRFLLLQIGGETGNTANLDEIFQSYAYDVPYR